MEPVGKFKEDFINVLGQAMEDVAKFKNSYEALVHIHEGISKMFDEVNEVDAAMMDIKKVSELDEKVKTVSVNTYDIDLKKCNINVDEWTGHAKPIKGIISVVVKTYEGFHFEFEVGGLVLLMEDGSFKIS